MTGMLQPPPESGPIRRVDSKIRKGLYIVAGSLSFGLGVLGIFLPLLPTTPFLLLTAWCWVRGSQKLHDWLLGHRIFGRLIKNYREGRGFSLRLKIGTLALLYATIGFSMTQIPHTAIRAGLFLVAAGVTIHIWRLPTARR